MFWRLEIEAKMQPPFGLVSFLASGNGAKMRLQMSSSEARLEVFVFENSSLASSKRTISSRVRSLPLSALFLLQLCHLMLVLQREHLNWLTKLR
jgi:hypothetical protein